MGLNFPKHRFLALTDFLMRSTQIARIKAHGKIPPLCSLPRRIYLRCANDKVVQNARGSEASFVFVKIASA
jgi:hypothetical protein